MYEHLTVGIKLTNMLLMHSYYRPIKLLKTNSNATVNLTIKPILCGVCALLCKHLVVVLDTL